MNLSLPAFSQAKILLVGDVMLDRYWYGATHRISPEAPVPVVHIQQQDECPGGAGNVALNISTLHAQTTLISAVGRDAEGRLLTDKLSAANVHCFFQYLNTPTTTKLRVLSQHQQLLRMDFEQTKNTDPLDQLLQYFEQQLPTHHLLVLSDYNKGVLSLAPTLIAKARQQGIPVLVDPKGADFSIYRGATLLTPNRKEFELIVGPCETEHMLEEKGRRLIEDYDLQALLITRGEQGMTLLQKELPALHLPPAHQHEVFDVTGAGDTVIATLAAALASGSDLPTSTYLANLAAGIAVTKLGTAAVTLSELQRAMAATCQIERGTVNETQLLAAVEAARLRGERIIMTNGCFDILHAGHVTYLEQAKKLGDKLIVAVNDDASVKRLKGPQRPINTLQQRMAVLAGLEAVDWVVPFSEDTPERLIAAVLPHVLVKGGDYKDPLAIPGARTVIQHGGEIQLLHFESDCSTTAIIERILQES
ncbi:MAG: bifunctional D-glycero-beta-D-manno-heptose-7-phosphate kinase/D-glycero-beta-D-manno-heptose 1-phosphate adenylyltransferase HldE [Gammaproteobacteria bacterium]|nr:bifunctional D-glycero-beta-D-manno-heptose-7-phosphate kinase/D-glycero-beta-D-manno-heptose 1-phosphate adenylyltransferase HldE [Gammaproteobacteria bacterium]